MAQRSLYQRWECVQKVKELCKQTCESILSSGDMFLFTQNKNLPIENTTDCLSTMASVCKVMLETPWVTFCTFRPASLSPPDISACNRCAPCPFQGVPQPIQQRGDGVVLPPGHGGSNHPVRLRPSCRSLRQVVQNRREYSFLPHPAFTAFYLKLTVVFLVPRWKAASKSSKISLRTA